MRKVLLVDDSPLFQKIVTMYFARRNELSLVYAASYKQAQEILDKDTNFFAAIVCIVLPDSMDGELVDLTISKKIPTLVLTSSIGEDIRKQMSRKPIIDYVAKNTRNDIMYAAELIQTLLYYENRKVLIVAKEQADRKQLVSLFSTILLKPVHANNGKEALEMLKKDKDLQLIATDSKLDDMSGLELVQNLRTRYTRDEKIVFAFTSSFEQNTNALFLKYGVNEIINKPFSKEEFNAKVFKELDFKKTINEIQQINQTVEKYILTSTTDTNGIIRQASDAFCEISGYTKAELIGQPQNIIRHPDMDPSVFKDMWDTIQSGKKWNGIIKNMKKTGGHYWVESHVEPIFNADGIITGYHAIRQDITSEVEVQEKSQQLEEAKKNITDSIKFSSLIQHALLPTDESISNFFNDFFILWEPKDIVGGDIYQFLEREDDCLTFVIDCTGHGVPGAFMTIVTKTVIQSIVTDEIFDNPAQIMKELNKHIQLTMKQDNPASKSDAGFDGGILYYNKKQKKIKYSGAKTPLFYIQNDELNSYKGDRQSIGYKKSNIDFEFTNFELDVDCDSYLYITTDGFIDQNGGEEGFPLGKKKFQRHIIENYKESFNKQKRHFTRNLLEFQGEHERDDDVTFFGCFISNDESSKIEYFFNYKGFLNQNKLGELEEEFLSHHSNIFENNRKREKVLTIYYELGQNITKYGIQDSELDVSYLPAIELAHDEKTNIFYMTFKNLISEDNKIVIEKRINEANSIDKENISKIYKEYRKSNKYSHDKGEGLGFFELVKRSPDKIQYSFENVDSRFYYSVTISI